MNTKSQDNELFRGTGAQDRVVARERAGFARRHLVWMLVAVILGASVWWATSQRLALGGHASVSRSRLVIASVQRATFTRDIAADGRVVAAVSPALYAPAGGNFTLLVHAGDQIAVGTLLGRVDSPDLTARLAQERASLQSNQAEYEHAVLDARIQLRSAQDAADKAKVDHDTAQRELERSRKAHDLGAYSELQVLRAQDALEKAEFDLRAARTALEARPQQNRFDLAARKAVVERQQSLVADLQRQVDALEIRSTVKGQVGRIESPDRSVVAKDVPLLTTVDLSALAVEIQVPESFARELAIGMPADISGSGGEWRGRVDAVSPEVVNGQVTARVRFNGTAPTGLRQNQRLFVRIVLDQRPNSLLVDRGSFLDQDGGAVAYVVHGNTAQRQRIRVGGVSVGKVQILAGLAADDQVVVSGTEAFDGAPRVTLSN